MIPVRIVLVSCVLLAALFGTNNCEAKINYGDIVIFFQPEENKPNCVKYIGNNIVLKDLPIIRSDGEEYVNGNNLDLGVGTMIGVITPMHSAYKYFKNKALKTGYYDYTDSLAIFEIYQNDKKIQEENQKLIENLKRLRIFDGDNNENRRNKGKNIMMDD
ncbi:uncharacterized protein LOC126846987 [Adelges cooleyi]|uniref:uncharacterized protein LOC126846987 n=1 Tax=Adelges cooleyi TaxID=133065 RepID=UPI00218068E0|nr:uncharacterized protein LOC126846987 [Adelges cooleyi]XP_050442864.1 uncharacterized protein LOC126846987 [Adelges cooleyi]